MDLTELQKKPAYPVVYMFAVMFCFTAVLVGLARSAAGRVEANNRIRFERAVLMAVGLEAEEWPPSEVHKVFVESIAPPTPESHGAYIYSGTPRAIPASASQAGSLRHDPGGDTYALPFEGQGFWNTIKGVIGIKSDHRTVTGIAFYEQSETPGLGAEIVKPRFRDQFKALTLSEGPTPLRLKSAGADAGEPGVDAITGATQTCTRLEKILNDAISAWRRLTGSGLNIDSAEKPGGRHGGRPAINGNRPVLRYSGGPGSVPAVSYGVFNGINIQT